MALRILAAIIGILPWRALEPLGAIVGWVAGSLLRIRRSHVEHAMCAAGIEGERRQARAMYRSLGASALELLWLARRGDESVQHVRVDGPSLAPWLRSRALGHGVVVAASHTGNWDLAACAIARQMELMVVTKRLSVTSFDTFWQSTRSHQGVSLVEANGAMRRARIALGRGAAVAMMIDQAPGSRRQALGVEFLGRPALADRAPAVLAAAAGAPLVVAASLRDSNGEHVLRVLDVIVPPERPTRRWIDEATLSATRALDGFVRAHPSQWLWLHRRWKTVDPTATKLGA